MRIDYKEPNKRKLEVGDILVLRDTDKIYWDGNVRMICKSMKHYQLVALDNSHIIPRVYSSLEEIMSDKDVQDTLVDVFKSYEVKLVVDRPQNK